MGRSRYRGGDTLADDGWAVRLRRGRGRRPFRFACGGLEVETWRGVPATSADGVGDYRIDAISAAWSGRTGSCVTAVFA